MTATIATPTSYPATLPFWQVADTFSKAFGKASPARHPGKAAGVAERAAALAELAAGVAERAADPAELAAGVSGEAAEVGERAADPAEVVAEVAVSAVSLAMLSAGIAVKPAEVAVPAVCLKARARSPAEFTGGVADKAARHCEGFSPSRHAELVSASYYKTLKQVQGDAAFLSLIINN